MRGERARWNVVIQRTQHRNHDDDIGVVVDAGARTGDAGDADARMGDGAGVSRAPGVARRRGARADEHV